MKIYYKIVTKDMYSLCIRQIFGTMHEAAIQYKENEWVYPRIPYTPLFVFKTFDDACKFLEKHNYCSVHIYKVHTKGRFLKIPFTGNIDRLKEIAKRKAQHKRPLRYNWKNKEIPPGTIAVKSVKLLEKIKTY